MTKKLFLVELGWYFMNKIAISSMQDAVLFAIMVSIAAAILLPSIELNTISSEEIGEKNADDILLSILNTRDDNFEYVMADSFLNSIASKSHINTQSSIYNELKEAFLGIQQKHKTYNELCMECVSSQLEFSDVKLNFLTEDFEKELKIRLNELLSNTGYKYNFSVRWQPINGLNFGGSLYIGGAAPHQAYVSRSVEIMPFFSSYSINTEEINKEIDAIKENFSLLKSNLIDEQRFLKIAEENLNEILEKILFYSPNSVINTTLNYFKNSISKFENRGFDILNKTLSIFGCDGILNTIKENITEQLIHFGFANKSFDMWNSFRDSIHNYFYAHNNKIHYFAIYIANESKDASLDEEIINWIYGFIDISHVYFTLSLWR